MATNTELRNMVVRTLRYSKVTIEYENRTKEKIVNGMTNERKEMMKAMKESNAIPKSVKVETKVERRAMDLETFIKNSELV